MRRAPVCSELHRVAELAVRNDERLEAWRQKYAERVAEAVRRNGCGTATTYDPASLAETIEEMTCAKYSTW